MLEFEQFTARHGEVVAQSLIERLERYEGIRNTMFASLEERWNRVMNKNQKEFDSRALAA